MNLNLTNINRRLEDDKVVAITASIAGNGDGNYLSAGVVIKEGNLETMTNAEIKAEALKIIRSWSK